MLAVLDRKPAGSASFSATRETGQITPYIGHYGTINLYLVFEPYENPYKVQDLSYEHACLLAITTLPSYKNGTVQNDRPV